MSKLVTFIGKLKRKKRSNKDLFDYQSIKEDDVQLTEDEEKSRNILNNINMSLCPVEYVRYKQFQKNHMHTGVNKGAIGGHISINVTMTSLGSAKSCHCSICGQSANITEYNW
jgi:hypothetical protein